MIFEHLKENELTQLFNHGSMTTKFHILNVHEGLGGHTKDGKCA